MDTKIWPKPPPVHPTLGASEVHIWRSRVRQCALGVAFLENGLSADERRRADAYRHEDSRQTFVVGRGLLRMLLARYLCSSASDLRFCVNEQGKPALASPHSAAGIQFNVSHSGVWIVYAVSLGQALGTDIERLRSMPDMEQIAESSFSGRESATLRSLPDSERQAAFFRCWVRKEAYLKALGKGLSIPLGEFDVSLAPGEPARLLRAWRDDPVGSAWRLRELGMGPDYQGALAVAGNIRRLRCWEWQGAPILVHRGRSTAACDFDGAGKRGGGCC